MTRVPQQILRFATLLFAVSATSVALAVATVEVTYTGPKAKIDETTIKLFDNTGSLVPPVVNTRDRFSVEPGTYTVEVYVQGKLISGTQRQKVNLADANNQLRVDSETGIATVVPPPENSASNIPGQPWFRPNRFGVFGGYSAVQDRPPPAGVYTGTTTLANETPGPRNKSWIPGVRFDVDLQGEEGPLNFRKTLGGVYGKVSRSTTVPAGTAFGNTYSIAAPTGQTGVFSSLGWNVNNQTKYDKLYFNGALPYMLKRDQDWTLYGEPEFRYQYQKTTYNNSLALMAPGVSSTLNQTDKENDWAFGWGVRGQRMLGNGFTLGLGAGLDLMYYSDRYNGTQHNLCSVCAMPVQDYSVATSDSKNGWTWATWVNAGAGYAVAKDVEVDLLARYRYEGKNSFLAQKVTPSDPTTHLDTDSRYNWSLQLGVAWAF